MKIYETTKELLYIISILFLFISCTNHSQKDEKQESEIIENIESVSQSDIFSLFTNNMEGDSVEIFIKKSWVEFGIEKGIHRFITVNDYSTYWVHFIFSLSSKSLMARSKKKAVYRDFSSRLRSSFELHAKF